MEEFTIRITINATPAELYNIWMDSDRHATLIGSTARIEPMAGGTFSMWDDYITGTHLDLIPHHKIIQRWRTTDFPPDAPDSILTVSFQDMNNQTLVVLHHHDIPDGQAQDYKEGWEQYYLQPLNAMFQEKNGL